MKALVGSWDHRPYKLLAENAALRNRVSELEEALRRSREETAVLRAALVEAETASLDVSDVEVALSGR